MRSLFKEQTRRKPAAEPRPGDADTADATDTTVTSSAMPVAGQADTARGTQAAQNTQGITGTLANHKGKLAVGAAAMLGLAVFYKWRESKLAKDDPEEYARLRRLKAAVDTEEG